MARLIGVLVSGTGTNLQALIDAGLPIAAVASNVPGAPALTRAETAGIPIAVFDAAEHESREARDAAVADWLGELSAAVDAGRRRVVSGPWLFVHVPALDCLGWV